jgi:hypothetical protein
MRHAQCWDVELKGGLTWTTNVESHARAMGAVAVIGALERMDV